MVGVKTWLRRLWVELKHDPQVEIMKARELFKRSLLAPPKEKK